MRGGWAENDGIRKIHNEVGDRVRGAAEKNDRAYAIMYISPFVLTDLVVQSVDPL